jgi:ABC-type branched-subunit amino acid transport system permease subunit
LIKWIVALLVPLITFTFLWSGDAIVNNVLLGLVFGAPTDLETSTLVLAAMFTLVFYSTIITLVGYGIATDNGQQSMLELWVDILFFILIPLLLIMESGLVIGMAVSTIVWLAYTIARARVRTWLHRPSPVLWKSLPGPFSGQPVPLLRRAALGGFWFGAVFAAVSLIVDVIFYISGQLPSVLLSWVCIRSVVLPVAGYFLGRLGGMVAVRSTVLTRNGKNGVATSATINLGKKKSQEELSITPVREETKDLVFSDAPLKSAGAQRIYLFLLTAFILFYPAIDPFLFGSGTEGRLSGYGDAGYYVILALGLNIVVGFAGLLDLGYVAFFAIGAYAWSIIGSNQLGVLTGLVINLHLTAGLFWPLLIVIALITALFGVLLGAPTLRLRGDYLAIVTLGFGEIVPVVFLELDHYTNGANGIVAVQSPALFGIHWSTFTSIPYYYLVVGLIVLVIFANIRLRDSRLGRAWIAIREDEIAAASSGINLTMTKLFAFAAGAFFAGIAGAYHAAKLGQVSPDAFSFGDSVVYLAMVVIGGIGSIPGVIVGALTVYAVNVLILAQLDTLAADPTSFIHSLYAALTQVVPGFTFGNIRNLIFGFILVVVMIFRPEGLLPSARRRRELHHAEETIGADALDSVPETPDFEQEVSVE